MLKRGKFEEFISIFADSRDNFIDDLEADTYGEHIVLKPRQFLSDVLVRVRKLG